VKVKADRFAAETRRKCLKEIEAAMFGRDGAAHRQRAQGVTRSADEEQYEKSEADAFERVEDRLHADFIDNVNEQREAKEKPRPAATTSSGARPEPPAKSPSRATRMASCRLMFRRSSSLLHPLSLRRGSESFMS
jgi:hypothetical protein